MKDLKELRKEIDMVDQAIIKLIAKRRDLALEVGEHKAKTAAKIRQPDRESEVIAGRRRQAEKNGLDPDMVEAVWIILMNHFVALQEKAAARATKTPQNK